MFPFLEPQMSLSAQQNYKNHNKKIKGLKIHMNSLLLEYQKSIYYLTSGVTSRGANPVPPVVNIKLSSFLITRIYQGFLKEMRTLSHAGGFACHQKYPHTGILCIQWGKQIQHSMRKSEVWGIYFIDHRKMKMQSLKILKVTKLSEQYKYVLINVIMLLNRYSEIFSVIQNILGLKNLYRVLIKWSHYFISIAILSGKIFILKFYI